MKVARDYTKQRLELLELEMSSLFESDKAKQKGLRSLYENKELR